MLIIKRELALPFLSREICSALFKYSIILRISLLILVIEHLELLAHLAISWKLSLTIRILIYIFIRCPYFHLVFQLLPKFFLLLLRNLNWHSLFFILVHTIVFSLYFLSVVVILLAWCFLLLVPISWTWIFALLINLVHPISCWRSYVRIVRDSTGLDFLLNPMMLLDMSSRYNVKFGRRTRIVMI